MQFLAFWQCHKSDRRMAMLTEIAPYPSLFWVLLPWLNKNNNNNNNSTTVARPRWVENTVS